MLRILFVILAVLAAVLAFIIKQPLLWGLAALFLVIAGISVLGTRRSSHKRDRETYARPPAHTPEEELRDLGIIEIKPKGGSVPSTGGAVEESVTEVPDETRSGKPGRRTRTSDTSGQNTGPQKPKVQVKEVDEEGHVSAARQNKEVIMPTIQSLQGAMRASTVCLLRKDATATHYHIEACVSQNSYARMRGYFSAREPLMLPANPEKPITLLRVGEKGIPPQSLGYYREPIAVRQVALKVVPHPTETYVLLADTMEENGLSDARWHTLLTQYAGLIASLLDNAGVGRADATAKVTEAPAPRPRLEIVDEEIRLARREGLPLALALVHLQRAETISEQGEEVLREAEALLIDFLQASTRTGRVVKFGELMYGVFSNESPRDIERWALSVVSDLNEETGLLEGGARIGLALLGDRHQDATAFRDDALAALEAAHHENESIIMA